MAVDYMLVARNVVGKAFGTLPADSSYLMVPEDATEPLPAHAVPATDKDKSKWMTKVLAEATRKVDKKTGEFGHILFYIHGYNNQPPGILEKHRKLRDDLELLGFHGIVISFDWPSGAVAALYLKDRVEAKLTALKLVSDGIIPLAERQQPDCQVNVHVLAHSMGTFVLREACDEADDRGSMTGMSWTISQAVLIGGDISSGSLSADNNTADSLYRHCVRLTNYSNLNDVILALSNAKRVGLAPRVGRVGLPGDAPPTGVNVDCSDYWNSDVKDAVRKFYGDKFHSWHVGDPVFTQDLFSTLMGIDRISMLTREVKDDTLRMKKPA